MSSRGVAGVDRLAIDTIRTLAIDAVRSANSGHPGAPLSLAPAAYVLFRRVMRHNPRDPHWPDRDRFVLSAGHASMLLYASLHLSGPGGEVLRQFGISAEHVASEVEAAIGELASV